MQAEQLTQSLFDLHASDDSLALAAYWRSLAEAPRLPARQDFDPTAVPTLLPRLIIREIDGDGTSRYRLTGTAVREVLGRDLRGIASASIIKPPFADVSRQSSRHMLDQPCGVFSLLTVTTLSGRGILVESTALPFAEQPGRARQAIGVVRAIGDVPGVVATPGCIVAVNALYYLDIGAGVPVSGNALARR